MAEERQELYSGPSFIVQNDGWMSLHTGDGKGLLIAQQVNAQVKGQAELQGEWVKHER